MATSADLKYVCQQLIGVYSMINVSSLIAISFKLGAVAFLATVFI